MKHEMHEMEKPMPMDEVHKDHMERAMKRKAGMMKSPEQMEEWHFDPNGDRGCCYPGLVHKE